MTWSTRPATVDDADEIGALHVAAWQSAYRGLLPDAVLDGLVLAEWQDRRRTHLADPLPGSLNRVVEQDGEVVGWCAIGPAREPHASDGAWELYAMYLHPRVFGAGAGWPLMRWCLEAFDRSGAPELVLRVLRDNDRARNFYARAGFEPDARAESKPFHGAADLCMRLGRPVPIP